MVDKQSEETLLAKQLAAMNVYQSADLVQALASALSQGHISDKHLSSALSQVGYSLPLSLKRQVEE